MIERLQVRVSWMGSAGGEVRFYGECRYQLSGIGMQRSFKEIGGIAAFDDRALLHDSDAVSDGGYGEQIVRDI